MTRKETRGEEGEEMVRTRENVWKSRREEMRRGGEKLTQEMRKGGVERKGKERGSGESLYVGCIRS